MFFHSLLFSYKITLKPVIITTGQQTLQSVLVTNILVLCMLWCIYKICMHLIFAQSLALLCNWVYPMICFDSQECLGTTACVWTCNYCNIKHLCKKHRKRDQIWKCTTIKMLKTFMHSLNMHLYCMQFSLNTTWCVTLRANSYKSIGAFTVSTLNMKFVEMDRFDTSSKTWNVIILQKWDLLKCKTIYISSLCI